MRAALDRALRGPDTPTGVVYRPQAKWRCWLGVHRWASVWDGVKVEETATAGRHTADWVFSLDRLPDYDQCVWCKCRRNVVGQEP